MKIIDQNTEYECGVCCVTMLIRHYKNKKTTKQDVLSLSDLTDRGLNLLDIENLMKKFSIEAQSYEANWDELFELKINKPFIILMENELNTNHYVVAKLINNETIEIYDPVNKKYLFKKEQINENYLGYICLIENVNKSKYISLDISKPIFNQIFSPNLIIIFVIELFSFGLSIFSSFLSSKLISLFKENEGFLYIVIFSILLLFSILFLLNKISYLLKNKFIFKFYMKTYYKYLNSLDYKSHNFFKITKENEFVNFNEYLKTYIEFKINFYINITLQSIILLSCLIIIIFNNSFFLLFISLLLIIKITITTYKTKINNKNNKQILEKSNEFSKTIINYFLNKKNYIHTNTNLIKQNIYKLEIKDYNNTNLNLNINNIESLLFKVINVLIFVFCFLKTNNEFEKILFLLTINNFLWSASSSIIDMISNNLNIKLLKEIIDFQFNSSNIKRNKLEESLFLIEKDLFYKSEKLLSSNMIIYNRNTLENNFEIFLNKTTNINNTKLSQIDSSSFLLLTNELKEYEKNIQNIINNHDFKNIFSGFLLETKINFLDFENLKNLDDEMKIILNLFSLNCKEDKIIIVDFKIIKLTEIGIKYINLLTDLISKNNKIIYITKSKLNMNIEKIIYG